MMQKKKKKGDEGKINFFWYYLKLFITELSTELHGSKFWQHSSTRYTSRITRYNKSNKCVILAPLPYFKVVLRITNQTTVLLINFKKCSVAW